MRLQPILTSAAFSLLVRRCYDSDLLFTVHSEKGREEILFTIPLNRKIG